VEKWFRMAVDHLPVGLLVIDAEGTVKVFNRLLNGLTGIKEGDVLGRPFPEVFDCQRPEPNKLLQTLVTREEFQGLKPETVIPSINSNAYETRTYIMHNDNGESEGAMAVFLPVERLHELENAVIKAEKLAVLGQLVAGVVHEIRNPLTAIGGFLELLQKQLKGTSKENYIAVMLAELKHVNRLITELLSLTKPGYPKRVKCIINNIVREVVMLVESEAQIRNVDLNLTLEKDIPYLLGDGEQLKQVFLNVIKNAFEAFDNGGRICLQTSWDEGEGLVKIAVEDNGPGVDGQTIDNIFIPFFTTKEKGTGLGMFLSKQIIDNHGGLIEVESEPGKGTTVTVLIPVSQL